MAVGCSVGGAFIVVTAVSALSTRNGQSWAHRLFNIRIVIENNEDVDINGNFMPENVSHYVPLPCPPTKIFVREWAHLLDFASLTLGFFWPLWDPHKQTFADKLLHTYVYRRN